jgi:pimeloyl-ACP methyl ester carboxylesterase
MTNEYAIGSMIAASIIGCTSPAAPARPTYVLVHGAWMGAAGWDDTAGELRAAGADVVTLDLPAHGADTTPVAQATLAGYRDAVLDTISQQKLPVILVGHSMGGMVITEAAEASPGAIERLVYVAAYLPADGDSLFHLAMSDADSQIGASLQFNGDTVGIDPTKFPDLFCADCSDAARAELVAGYRVEPGAPLEEMAAVTPGGAGSVPKTYIYTSQDRVVSPALQQRMSATTPVDRTATLDTSHAAMLSHPHELATLLLAQ